jgi:cytochrome c oxidase subunit II
MTPQAKRIWIGVFAVTLVCLLAVLVLLLIFNFAAPQNGMGMQRWMPGNWMPGFLQRFDSNGERIFFTATSESGTPITPELEGMGRMRGMRFGQMTCAACHGDDGRGGVVRMMMERFEAPDIRYETLTEEEHGQGEEEDGDHEEHPPYTDETIKRAITEGIDPAGEPLDWPMPRWEMDERDLDDLVEFLKTLE